MFLLLSFLALLVGFVTANFGNCDAYGTNCDWWAYLADVWTYGIWAWIIAGILFGIFVLYLFIKCCCCCCLWIAKGIVKALTCCCKCRTLSNLAIWMVRLLVLFIFALGLAGFILAVIGWGKVSKAVENSESDYDQYITMELPLQTNMATMTLSVANTNLTTVGQLTNQPALLSVLNSSAINSANTTQQSMESTWEDFRDPYVLALNKAFSIFFWISIATPGAVLVAIFILAIFMRCGTLSPTLLTIFGFLAAVLLWCAIGVASVGFQVIDDTCNEVALVINTNATQGWGFLNKLQCTLPSTMNEFAPTVIAYNQATSAAYQGACGSVRPQCSAGTMSCPSIPSTCTSFSQVSPLGEQIKVVPSASNGGCDNSCTATACSSICTGATLSNASKGLAISVQTASALITSNTTTMQPLVTCQFITDNFLLEMQSECQNGQKGAKEVLWGMTILGIASVAGIAVTMFLSHWFDRTDSSGSNKNAHHSHVGGDGAARYEGEELKEAAFQAEAAQMEAEYADGHVAPTSSPDVPPHLP